MTSFEGRLAVSLRLESPFIETFNSVCRTHQIVKFGVETTRAQEFHNHIRGEQDFSSQFIRYLTDAILIRVDGNRNPMGHQTALVEFKVSDTSIREDSFFNRIRSDYGNGPIPLLQKEDIFDMERDAFRMYRNIAQAGVKVVVVGLQTRRETDDRLRAQYAEHIVVCNEHTPAGGRGSRTPAVNVHFGSFLTAGEFFQRELGVHPSVTDAVIRALE